MRTALLAGLRAHKLRLALTALAIVLGTTFVAGTLVLTDTLRQAFTDIFEETNAGTDVAVRGEAAFSARIEVTRPAVPLEVLDAVRGVEGVADAAGEVQGLAQVIGPDGQPAGPAQGPPPLAFGAPEVPELAAFDLVAGRYPEAEGEVALNAGVAAALGLTPGDRVDVIAEGPVAAQTLVGTIALGDNPAPTGGTIVIFDPATALALYGEDGYDQISAVAAPGVEREVLAGAVAAAVGDDYEVLTGDELAASTSAEVTEFLGFFTTALLVFAAIALLVGAFLIANTFAIVVAQRTRELALLRAVGASRGQVLGGVLGEAGVVGLLGSALGLAAGVGIASALRALLDRSGVSLPGGPLVFLPRTALLTIGLGLSITLLAALAPALRAVRVPPVAAMQAVAAPPPPRLGRSRWILGGLVTVAGLAAISAGLLAGAGITAVGAGALLTLLGAALLSPLVTRPLVRLLGGPAAALSLQGRLARDNALRSPRRTAATASALMIGLGLVTFVAIAGTSITRSAEEGLEAAFRSEFTVSPAAQGPPGQSSIPRALVTDLSALDEVAVAMPLSFAEIQVGDQPAFAGAADPGQASDVLALEFLEGGFGDWADGGVVVSDDVQAAQGIGAGDAVEVTFATGDVATLPVRGVFDGERSEFDWLLDEATFAAHVEGDPITAIYVKLAEGTDPAAARPALEMALAPYPTVVLADLDEVKAMVRDQIGQLLGLLSGLLGLSVIIALVGIVNTLGLSVLERTRELGLLRAVGATRRQVRAMVRWEAVIIALLGALFGIVIGLVFGWLLVRGLADLGITVFAVPGGQLLAGLVLAAVAGVVAAIWPARRAARTEILRALEAQ